MLLNNTFVLVWSLGISCNYALNLQFAFWSLLGVISPPPTQVSVMGG